MFVFTRRLFQIFESFFLYKYISTCAVNVESTIPEYRSWSGYRRLSSFFSNLVGRTNSKYLSWQTALFLPDFYTNDPIPGYVPLTYLQYIGRIMKTALLSNVILINIVCRNARRHVPEDQKILSRSGQIKERIHSNEWLSL